MRRTTMLLLPLLLASGAALQAQTPHVGFSLNLVIPTGDFASRSLPPYYSSFDGHLVPTQKETYDVGLGGSFTVSFPVDRALAIRLNLSGSAENGINRAQGEANINLRHSLFSLGGDLQIFPEGTAYRHRGFYFVAGLSADFEQFDNSFGDPQYDYTDTMRKSRMGGSIGFGHSFGYDAGVRFTLEATFHKTLTSHDVDAGDPPSTDFVKVGFGFVF
jgi:hypothetical protein